MSLPSGLLRIAAPAALAVVLGCGLLHRGEPPRPGPIDLNTASRAQIATLPGITPSMAQMIVDGRPYGDPEDLVTRNILTERELRRIADRVTVAPRR
jgi:hypothetical protein